MAAAMAPLDDSALKEIASLPKPRLLLQLVADAAQATPTKTWGSIPLDSQDASLGYQDVSYRRLAYAVDRTAAWMRATVEPHRLRAFEPLAYIGPPDSRYMIFALGAIKAGFQMLYLSPRNSNEAQFAVMNEADCHKWLCSNEMKDRVEALQQARPPQPSTDLVFAVPEQHDLLKDEPTPAFPYSKTLEEARYEPLAMLHTSSTTGLPKLIPINQGYGFHEDVLRHYPPSEGLDLITRKPFDGHCRLYLAMPPFHAGGLLLGLLKSLYHDIIMVFQPPAVPVNATVIDGILRHGRCDGAVLPPYLVEEMCAIPEYFDTLANLKFVQFGSGPLSTSCGDTLLTRQKNCPHYIGTTEVGLLPVVELEDVEKEWQYFHFHPWGGVDLRPIDNDGKLFELWIKKLPIDLPGLQPVFELFPHLTEWPTRDLYAQHPDKPYLWRARGRADDVLVLSNGEKLNPVDTEGRISNAHPAVVGALVVGQGRFQPGLLLEVKGVDVSNETAKKDLIEAIWPIVEAANKLAPKHGQLTRSMILFSIPQKPFYRTPKLSVRRKPTVELYADEIDDMYRRVENDEGVTENPDLPPVFGVDTVEAAQKFVADLIDNITGWSGQPPQADLFMLGMDSLHVARIVRALKAGLKGSPGVLAGVNSRLIYANPTVAQLGAALHDLDASGGPGANGPRDQTREAELQAIIDRWTAGLPQTTNSGAKGAANGHINGDRDHRWSVILTGSTGSLGSYLLQTLLGHPSVSDVICLNRSPDAAAKWKKMCVARGLSATEATQRVQFFQTGDLGAPNLGLDAETYQMLCHKVTHVIQNAWPVNFNLTLASIEKVHIAGVRRMVDFAAEADKCPKLIFVSSLSSITSGNLIQPVAEQVMRDNGMPAHMGYGESKYVSERILDAATTHSKGQISTTVLRVGQISGPDETAAKDPWNPQEWFPSIIASSHTVGVLPDTLGRMENADWIPVNVLARIVVELMESGEQHHIDDAGDYRSLVYHLLNPASVTWHDALLPVVKKWFGIDKVVPLSEWAEHVDAGPSVDDQARPNPAKKIIAYYKALADVPKRAGPRHLTDETVKASPILRNLGPVREAWMQKWLVDWGFESIANGLAK